MTVKLIWATPNIDSTIGYIARVSNIKAKPGDSFKKLIGYLIGHKHWSPLEMANVCVEIQTTRDIARQILRHRSFHFQEFSQRYAEVEQEQPVLAVARLQDHTNRQNSLDTTDQKILKDFDMWQQRVWEFCHMAYQACLKMGVAKELARKLLPEGLTYTRMYMNGTVRDWYHYVQIRTGPETQAEHRWIAMQVRQILREVAPTIFNESTYE